MKPAATCALFACTVLAAQQPPVFQTETKIVLIDVIATNKKGDFVRDLTAKDFRVWEDNREQTIRSFSLESGPSDSEPARLILFLDGSNMNSADQARIRQVAANFIDANASPNHLMAVVTFDGAFRIAQSFTQNADRLKQVIQNLNYAFSASANPGASIADRAQVIAAAGANSRGLSQALASLARNLGDVPGRKMVVLFTGASIFTGSQLGDLAGLIESCNRSNVAIYPVLQAALGSPLSSGLECYPGRGGLPASVQPPACSAQDTSLPYTLANSTGGFVTPASNDLLAQLQKVSAEQNQYYVIGYNPPESKPESCHALRVKVDRSGVTLRARSNYCSEKPQDILAATRTEQDLEKRAAASETIRTIAAIQAPFFYNSPNVARVHVAMEIAPDALKFENVKGKFHAEMNVLGIASAPGGAVAARFSDVVKRDFDSKQEADKFKENPLHYEKEFKIVPGQYNLTVVFSSSGTNFGKAVAPLAIPPLDRSHSAVSGIALGKEIRPAAELGLEASLTGEGTPLVAGGMQLIPTGSNVFAKGEQAFCYFEVYAPDGADAGTLQVRILDSKTGAVKWDGGEAKIELPAAGKISAPIGLGLPVASLPSGVYRIEAAASGGAISTVGFEIR